MKYGGFLSALFSLGSLSALHAQVLLIVNASNPGAVTITSTGMGPAVSTSTTQPSGYAFLEGFELEGLFDSSSTFQGSLSSANLTTGDSSEGPFYDLADANDASTGKSSASLDLNLFASGKVAGEGNTESFTQGDPAFIGKATLDLSGQQFSNAEYGVVAAGFSGSTLGLTPIGTYELIVPEPSIWTLVLTSLGLLSVYGYRLRTSSE